MAAAALGASANAAEPGWDRPLLLSFGIGLIRSQYSETFQRPGSLPAHSGDVRSAPGIELLSEYGAEHWTLWLNFEFGQADPYYKLFTEIGADWLLASWDHGTLGLGAEFAFSATSSIHGTDPGPTDPMGGSYRYGDVWAMPGAYARVDHWIASGFRVEFRAAFLTLAPYAKRTYSGGIVDPDGDGPITVSVAPDLEGALAVAGDLLFELSVGEAFQLLLAFRSDFATYRQTAYYVTGPWESTTSAFAWSTRLMLAKRI